MYELIQVSDNSYYIQCPAKIGLVKISDKEVCLIDSGNDKDAGRKVRKILDANGWQLKMILNTHSNADHIGGNRYLQDQTGCKIYARGIECDFTRHPVLLSSISSGIDPLLKATTGVPQNIASATLSPKGSSKLMGCSKALASPNSLSLSLGPELPT